MNPLLPWPLALPLAGLGLASLLALALLARRRPAYRAWPREAAALALLLALVAGFFWRPLFTHDVWLPIGGGDLASFFYPLYSFIHGSIAAGQFPLWNPYTFGGMPLAADVQSGMFYAPNLLAWYNLRTYTYGTLESLLILHYGWAALGMYLWLRDGRLLRPAAVAGAAAFTFCGFMTAHFGHMPMIFAASWLPWNLLLARRAAGSRNPAWVAPAGLALALTFLAGHPQTALYEGLALVLYWGFLALSEATWRAPDGGGPWLRPLPPAWRVVAWRFPLILLIAAGLSAVQLLPAQELAGQSLRAGITYEQATEHAMQPVGLLNLILPRVYGANPQSYWVPWQSTENWGYLGAIVLLLAAGGLFLRRDRRLGFLTALGGLALLGMLGPFSIVFSWLHGLLPGFDKFRAAGRLLLLLSVAVAGLAALGLDALLRLLPQLASAARAMLPAGAAAPAQTALGAALAEDAVVGAPQLTRVRQLARMVGLTAAFAGLVLLPLGTAIFLAGFSVERAQIVLNDLYMLVIWLALAAAILGAAVRGRLAGRTAALLLAVLLVLDLFSPNSHFNPTSETVLRGYDQQDAIDFLRKGTGPPTYFRVDSDTDVGDVWQPLLGTLQGIPDAGGLYNPLELRSYAGYWDVAKAHRNSVLYDLLSIKYTLALSRAVIADPKFVQVADGNQFVKIAANQHADPRLFLMHDALIEPDEAAAVGKLLNGTVLGWHTIYLAGGTERRSTMPSTLEAGSAEHATITRYTPNQVEADVDVRQDGWAVLSDVWYPGWTASVDDQLVPVERADSIFRAVRVGPGRHKIVLRFNWPGPLRTGAAISGATLLLTLLGAGGTLWHFRRRRPRRLTPLAAAQPAREPADHAG